MLFKNQLSPEGLQFKSSSQLHELYIHKFMELYYWEMKMLETLTLLQTATESVPLQEKIALYQRKKGEQVEGLQQAFILIDIPITGKKSDMTENMLENCDNLTHFKNRFNDYHIMSMILYINHFNQATYTWLHSLAPSFGFSQITNCLNQNLMIEKEFNQKIIALLCYGL